MKMSSQWQLLDNLHRFIGNIHSLFFQQIFIKHLLCANHFSDTGKNKSEGDKKDSCLHGTYIAKEKNSKSQVNRQTNKDNFTKW